MNRRSQSIKEEYDRYHAALDSLWESHSDDLDEFDALQKRETRYHLLRLRALDQEFHDLRFFMGS